MQIKVGELNINYSDTGSGRVLLLLHGWGANNTLWNGIIRAFSPYFRIVAPDFPGCGGSDLPKEAMTNEDYAVLVHEFIKILGLEDPVFVGHSHGGRVILKMLEKGCINPEKVVLFGSAGIVLPKTLRKKIKIFTYKTVKNVLLLPGVRRYSGNLLDKARKYFGSADYATANDVMRRTMVNVIGEDMRHMLGSINASVLLIWGDNDKDTPLAAAKIMEGLIPDAGLCVIKGAGHYSYLDRPGEVVSILQSFLKKEMGL